MSSIGSDWFAVALIWGLSQLFGVKSWWDWSLSLFDFKEDYLAFLVLLRDVDIISLPISFLSSSLIESMMS